MRALERLQDDPAYRDGATLLEAEALAEMLCGPGNAGKSPNVALNVMFAAIAVLQLDHPEALPDLVPSTIEAALRTHREAMEIQRIVLAGSSTP